jgi:hypothetical protein
MTELFLWDLKKLAGNETTLGIPKGRRIDAIFRTYSGKTYIFYDKVLYIEFDECLFRSKKNGLISELFAGIPPNISRAFGYRNLYFFKDKMYYEFDNISNTLVKSDKFDLTIFGFKCGLVDQIIKLIVCVIHCYTFLYYF